MKAKNLSIEQYLEKNKPYLHNMIVDYQVHRKLI